MLTSHLFEHLNFFDRQEFFLLKISKGIEVERIRAFEVVYRLSMYVRLILITAVHSHWITVSATLCNIAKKCSKTSLCLWNDNISCRYNKMIAELREEFKKATIPVHVNITGILEEFDPKNNPLFILNSTCELFEKKIIIRSFYLNFSVSFLIKLLLFYESLKFFQLFF